MPAEALCQANRGINAVGFSELTKYCNSFRFFEAFLCPFLLGGHTFRDSFFSLKIVYKNSFYAENVKNDGIFLYNILRKVAFILQKLYKFQNGIDNFAPMCYSMCSIL